MIRQYLSNIINDNKTQSEWKIQLTMTINFIYSKDSNKTRDMHKIRDNIEIMISYETDEITKDFFEFLLKNIKKN